MLGWLVKVTRPTLLGVREERFAVGVEDRSEAEDLVRRAHATDQDDVTALVALADPELRTSACGRATPSPEHGPDNRERGSCSERTRSRPHPINWTIALSNESTRRYSMRIACFTSPGYRRSQTAFTAAHRRRPGMACLMCWFCRGVGLFNCPECDGKGRGRPTPGPKSVCSDCGGAGRPKCQACAGSGCYTRPELAAEIQALSGRSWP